MAVGWFYHEQFLEHETGPEHPERPERLRALVKHFDETGLLKRMKPFESSPLVPNAVWMVHDPQHEKDVSTAFDRGVERLDPDTPISAASYEAALRAAGAVVRAAAVVMRGKVQRAFCAVRPPGHHAEHDHARGFCLFNNVAIAAEALVREHGLDRVAIVDFDVHHGNGTQHIFEERADVLFISIHEDGRYLYPGTGHANETGRGAGEGYTLNVPMAPRTGDQQWIAAFDEKIVPKLEACKPQFLLISAGFDAAKEDPLSHIELTERGFAHMTRRLVEVAERHCEGRIVSTLEGGYDLAALSRCAAAHVQELLKDPS